MTEVIAYVVPVVSLCVTCAILWSTIRELKAACPVRDKDYWLAMWKALDWQDELESRRQAQIPTQEQSVSHEEVDAMRMMLQGGKNG